MTRKPRSTWMLMFEDSIGPCVDWIAVQAARSSLRGHRFRIALPTWLTVAFLGAIVAVATSLLGDRDWHKDSPAKSTLIVNTGTIKSIAFRPDGAMLLSVGFNGSLAMLDPTRSAIPAPPLGLGPVRCAAFSPNNRVLATANATATVSLYDLVDRRSRTFYDISASTTYAACLAFSPDGETLAVGQQDGKITLWNAATGRKRSTLVGHKEFVASLVFAPDGTTLASSGGERTTRHLGLTDLPRTIRDCQPDEHVRRPGVFSRRPASLWGRPHDSDRAALGCGHGDRARRSARSCRRGRRIGIQPRRRHAGRGRLSRSNQFLGRRDA